MKRKRKTNLGSSTVYHVKGARQAYKDVLATAKRAVTSAEAGYCVKAFDNVTVAVMDHGTFLTELKHGVGAYGRRGPAAVPRMRQTARNAVDEARKAFARNCMVK